MAPGKDSIARYTDNTDLYYVNQRPQMELVRKKTQETNFGKQRVDQIESEQKKIERELIERYKQLDFQISKQKYHSLLRFSRAMFLAISLPPYILAIGIPKWMIQTGLPLFFGTMGHLFAPMLHFIREGKEKIGEAIESIFQLIKGQFETVTNFFNVSKGLVQELFNTVVSKPIVSLFQSLLKAAALPKQFVAVIKSEMAEFFNHFKSFVKFLPKDSFKEVVQGCKRILQAVREAAARSGFAINATLKMVVNSVQRLAVKATEAASQVSNTISHLSKEFGKEIKQFASKAIEPLIQALVPVREWVDTNIVGTFHAVQNYMRGRRNSAKEKLKKIGEVVKNSAKEKIAEATAFCVKMTHTLIAYLPMNPLLPFLKQKEGKKGVRKQPFKNLKRKMEQFRDKLLYLAGIFSRANQAARDGLKAFIRKTQKLPDFFVKFISFIINILRNFLQDFFLGVKVIAVAVKILLLQCNLMLKVKMIEIINWLERQQVGRK